MSEFILEEILNYTLIINSMKKYLFKQAPYSKNIFKPIMIITMMVIH